VEPLRRAVVHALEMAEEDVAWWCDGLSEKEMFARHFGLPPVAFQLRHMVRSMDRLLTYAEGRVLDEAQLAALGTEMAPGTVDEVMGEFRVGLKRATGRVLAIDPASFAEARGIGRKMLPTTVAGLLIHCAEHTQRHVGQMVTTVKVVRGREQRTGNREQ